MGACGERPNRINDVERGMRNESRDREFVEGFMEIISRKRKHLSPLFLSNAGLMLWVQISPTVVTPVFITVSILFSSRIAIIFVRQSFFCSYQVNDPVGERMSLNSIEQGRQFKMGVEIDEAGQEHALAEVDRLMAGIFPD